MNQPKGIGVIFQPKLRIKKNSPNSYTDEQAMKEGEIKCFKFFIFSREVEEDQQLNEMMRNLGKYRFFFFYHIC